MDKDYITEIYYATDGCTGIIAFIVKMTSKISGKFYSYKSAFVYENTSDAYFGAVDYLSKS